MLKLKVGADLDVRRPPARRRPRRGRGGGAHRPRRQPALGRRRRRSTGWRGLRRVRPVLDRGADLARRRPRPSDDPRRACAPIRVATGEHVQNRVIFKQLLQAEAIDVVQIDACRVGGVNENLAILLLAAKFGVPVCPHAGGVGLCEMVQHLAMFDFVAVSGVASRADGSSTSTTSTSTSPTPVVVERGRYRAPTQPGGGARLRDDVDRASSGSRTDRPGRASGRRDAPGRRPPPRVGPRASATSRGSPARPWRRSGATSRIDDLAADGRRRPASTARSSCRPSPTSPRPRSCSTWPPARRSISGVVGLRRPRPRPTSASSSTGCARGRRRRAGSSASAASSRTSPTPSGCSGPTCSRGLREVAARGLVYDLLIRPHQLAAASAAVTQVPEGRFVLDHLAKPAIAVGRWRAVGHRARRAGPRRTCRPSSRAWSPRPTGRAGRSATCGRTPSTPCAASVPSGCCSAPTGRSARWPRPTAASSAPPRSSSTGSSPSDRDAVLGGTATDVYRLRHRRPSNLRVP